MSITKEEFTARLNKDLEHEFQSIVQYVQHIASVKGARYQETMNELESHLRQEMSHALTLAKQIDFLGEVPSTTVPHPEAICDPIHALNQDLELETRQLDRYRERVEQAGELGLPDVAEALSPLLHQTQDHIRHIRTALGI